MNVKVADLMSRDVVAAQRRHTVARARETMRSSGVHALPVVHPDGTVAVTPCRRRIWPPTSRRTRR